MEGPRPYDFEPIFTAEELQAMEIARELGPVIDRIVRPPRLGHVNWCMCANCGIMPTETECVCCHEVDNFNRLMSSPEGCIPVGTDFENVCQNKAVLRATLVMRNDIRGHARNMAFELDMKSFRYAAYRMFIYWVHGRPGRGVRKVLCGVEDKADVPEASGVYIGFIITDGGEELEVGEVEAI